VESAANIFGGDGHAIDHGNAYVVISAAFQGLAVGPQERNGADAKQDARHHRKRDTQRAWEDRSHNRGNRKRDRGIEVGAVQVVAGHQLRTLPRTNALLLNALVLEYL